MLAKWADHDASVMTTDAYIERRYPKLVSKKRWRREVAQALARDGPDSAISPRPPQRPRPTSLKFSFPGLSVGLGHRA